MMGYQKAVNLDPDQATAHDRRDSFALPGNAVARRFFSPSVKSVQDLAGPRHDLLAALDRVVAQ
ncbi:hypothetical protein BO78DRAFT_125376 [Aspergillus sclerotiicarbonarius CBS 121057]|uniref:Uncharacterized protein n=1 Tax=Aspergillus sclerotiicarbonarius (strain CBS 121057 / IBT 28362) TaxID=1448318 RepID=A0A319EE98_ASPSB|nr:hypothetical protein BO78DRAFT_125376 [Aspergillus sclerotiicarbonarius CBS 121057]